MEKFLRLPRALHVLFGFTLAISSTLITAFASIDSSLYETALLLHVVFMFYWMLYPYAICNTLMLRVKAKIELSYNWFLFNWVVTFFGLMLLEIASYIFQQNEFRIQGWPALFVFYFFYAFLFTFLFTARVLKITEKGENVSYGESVGAALGLAIIPINFLVMHNRVLKALNKPLIRNVPTVD